MSFSRPKDLSRFFFLLLFSSAIFSVSFLIDRHQSGWLFIAFVIGFSSYFKTLQDPQVEEYSLFGVGLGMRLMLLLTLPTLSDDFYRFIWDGTLLKAGENPYLYLPKEAMALGIESLNDLTFQQLNSPNYYTIYPPVNQAIFWLASTIGGFERILLSVNVIRVILLAADLLALYLLKRMLTLKGLNIRLAYWYFLNPLVILEFTGNLHFEGLVICFMLLGLLGVYQNRILMSTIGMGMAIATKLVPLILLPSLLFSQWFKKGFWASTGSFLLGMAFFLPLIGSAFYGGLFESIGLYFRTFEFNASLYYMAREVGYWVRGYNMIHIIGPLLATANAILIITWSVYGSIKKKDISLLMLCSFCIYWLLSTTVHPWYLLSLIPLGLLSGYYFPVLWSFTATFTYLGYTSNGYDLNPAFLFAEYLLVLGFFIFELIKKRNENRI